MLQTRDITKGLARRLINPSSQFKDMDFESFAENNLIIRNRYGSNVPFVFNDVQRHYLANRTGRDIIVKSRQLGLSTLIQGYTLYQNVTTPHAIATITDHSDNTAKFRLMSEDMYSNIPKPFGKRVKSNASITVYHPLGGQYHCYTAGNRRAGRSSTFQGIHCSEVAYWDDAKTVLTGLLETMPYGYGWVALESTANGQQGYFYDIVQDVINGHNTEWAVHFYGWWWESSYQIPLGDGEQIVYTEDEQKLADKHNLTPSQIKWRRAKVEQHGDMFQQEYPETIEQAFIGSSDSLFGSIAHLFTIDHPIPYNPNHRYCAGADLGQQNDYTVVFIMDMDTRQIVNMLRINKMSYDDIGDAIIEFCKAYKASLLIEINVERSVAERVQVALKEFGIETTQFFTGEKTKPPMIKGLKYALERDEIQLLNVHALKSELNTFSSHQTPSGHWQYKARGNAHDDCVMALALTWAQYNRI